MIDYAPLHPDDEKATEHVAQYMLRLNRDPTTAKLLTRTMWHKPYHTPILFTAAAPYAVDEISRIQPAVAIERDCGSFKISSLTKKSDLAETYTLITFQCQFGADRIPILVGVSLENHVPVRIYNGSLAPVCLPERETEKAKAVQ